MESDDRHLPDYDALTNCTWCGAPLGQNAMPSQSAKVFCSRSCEIEGNFWVYQELCAIAITNPPQPNKHPRNLG